MSRACDEEQGQESNKERVDHRVGGGPGVGIAGIEVGSRVPDLESHRDGWSAI